jgi:hypothetical protein
MPLTGLSCGDNELTNLEPLRGMPLKSLDCGHNRLTNLEPLGGMSLTELICRDNKLTSLEPFVRTPPAGPFFFDCETLPEDELQRALVAWRQDPSHQQHARNAEVALLLRRNDVAALCGLARPFNGHAYLFIPRWLTWAEAKSFCEKYGGHLATVTSQEENEFVGSLSGAPGYGVWIGLEVAEGKAAWVTGEPLGFQAYPAPFYSRMRGKTVCMGSDCRWLNVASTMVSCFVIEWDK